MYQFSPPTVLRRTGVRHPLFGRQSLHCGETVLKESGVYRQVSYPSAEEVGAADIAYLGGHIYEIDATEVAALTAAGYGEWVTEVAE